MLIYRHVELSWPCRFYFGYVFQKLVKPKWTKIKPRGPKFTKSYYKADFALVLVNFALILFWFWPPNQKKYNFVLFWSTKIEMIDQFCFVSFCFVLYLQMLSRYIWTENIINYDYKDFVNKKWDIIVHSISFSSTGSESDF